MASTAFVLVLGRDLGVRRGGDELFDELVQPGHFALLLSRKLIESAARAQLTPAAEDVRIDGRDLLVVQVEMHDLVAGCDFPERVES